MEGRAGRQLLNRSSAYGVRMANEPDSHHRRRRDSRASSPRTSSRRPGAACSSSTRRTARTSAARPSGRSAGCSSSTAPSSGGWASRTRTSSRSRTGSGRRSSTASARTTGRGSGRRPTCASRRPRSASTCGDLGLRVVPLVGWAERGGADALGHGNSVPRFHLTWGTGPEVVRVFAEPVLAAEARGLVRVRLPPPRRRARSSRTARSSACAERSSSRATRLAASARRARSPVTFELRAGAVVVTTGGIGHNFDLIRRNWPADRLGPAPEHMISGVPGTRRRADARDRRGRRRQPGQPRPDVALHRGHPQLGPDLAAPRDPDHPRPVVAVARRERRPHGGAELPGLRHARHAQAHPLDRPRLLVVHPHPVDHREGVRALRLRAEPGRHRQGPQAARSHPDRRRRPGTGRGVQAPRRGLRRARRRCPNWSPA